MTFNVRLKIVYLRLVAHLLVRYQRHLIFLKTVENSGAYIGGPLGHAPPPPPLSVALAEEKIYGKSYNFFHFTDEYIINTMMIAKKEPDL